MRALRDSSPNVVLIEDDPAVQTILKEALEAGGLRVHAFASPFLALAFIRRAPPEVLVLDWHLPEMNGHAVVEQLRRQLDALPPIVVVTGDVRLKVPFKVAEVMRKPVSLVRFVERVASLTVPLTQPAQTRTA
jgi:CheY-like chemotaxis protein